MDALYTVLVPDARLDIRLREDLVEEVGRLAGYHKLVAKMPTETITIPTINKEWHARDIAREVMLAAGFSDVYTYAFNGRGEIEVANPIAADKKFLRNNLMGGLHTAVAENLKYESEVRIFEFGHIFGKTDEQIREESSFAAVMGFQKRKEVQMKADFYTLKGVLETVFSTLGISDVHYEDAGGELVASVYAGKELLGVMSINGFELDFAKMVELMNDSMVYTAPSRFPSIIRDISLFVPMTTKVGDVKAVIAKAMGEIVRTVELIDVFEKPEEQKKSLAFRMVLQSFEKTLADDEANAVSNSVIAALEATNPEWQVRK
jgi:phenylalanyl-tRNA synthetase beta chain